VASSECWIAAKGVFDLSGASGWHFYYLPASRRLGLRINDGQSAVTEIETANNQIPAYGTDFWARVEVDRTAGLVRFYVNDSLVGTGDISAVTGSVNNSEYLKVGGYGGSANYHEGDISFIRFDTGRVLSAAWHDKEWDNIRYGMPRDVLDFLARWNFESSLVDDSDNLYTLVWQGGGSPTYVTGYPSSGAPITYAFVRNFDVVNEGPQDDWLDTDDSQRTLDGSAYCYPGPLKKRWEIGFSLINLEQCTIFRAVEAGRDQFGFYADASEPLTFNARFGERLKPQVLMDGWYSLKMILEEV
jgi:hypothetical protein